MTVLSKSLERKLRRVRKAKSFIRRVKSERINEIQLRRRNGLGVRGKP